MVCRETFFRQLTSLSYQTSGCSKTKNSCQKISILLSQSTDVQKWIWLRFHVVICINKLRVHDATIQRTYVGSPQTRTFADTRNILVVFSECDRTPDRGPDFCFFTLTCFFTLLVLLLFLCHLDCFDCHVTDTLQLVK